MSRICPDCNREYSSRMDICYDCYNKLVKQYTEEAKDEMAKYYGKDQDEWSSMYQYATTDLLTYGEDDFRNEPNATTEEMLLYYFTKRYVKEKIKEHCQPIREKRKKETAENLKQFLKQAGIYDEVKKELRQTQKTSKEN